MNKEDPSENYYLRSKIVMATCLKVGRKVMENLGTTFFFKQLLYKYSVFHDGYYSGSEVVSQ